MAGLSRLLRNQRPHRPLVLGALALVALFSVLLPQADNSAQAATIVTQTEHVRLGLNAAFPFGNGRSDVIEGLFDEDLISYNFSINGTANIAVDMGVDVTFTYDREALVAGGTVPVQVTYTPTDDAGPELSLDASGTLVADVDVTTAGYAELCTVFPPICPVLAAVDSIDEEVPLTLAAGSADFAAPLDGDANVVVPLSGDTITVSLAGLDVVQARLEGDLTLSPAGPGAFPGLGGAVGVASVSGATIDGGFLPTVDILEWQSSGETLTLNLELPVAPGTTEITLQPVLHWVGTSANLALDIDLVGALGLFGDPSDISIFSGSLGEVYQDLGIDTQLGDAVADIVGFDPGVADRVADGFLPIPLTDPELASVPPIPSLGSVTLSIDADADDDGIPDGTELTGSNPTDPDDSDSDDDVLTDGCEVEGSNPTDPLDADSDDDALTDSQEDADHDCALDAGETDPNDPDSDDDGLNDGVEVANGTDPLDADSDDDGILDGEDVEFIQNAINGLPNEAFKGNGHRNAILAHLDAIENRVAQGQVDQALAELATLREHMDGCGTSADNTDWIVDCPSQLQIRALIDLLITNLSS